MKKIILAAAILASSASVFAADVGVSINIAQPGMYGRIDIGSVPAPQVVYTRPTVVYAAPPGVVYEPLYLYVPPGHQKHWNKHCSEYGACGRPVYFVQENWYRDVYVPRYREHHGEGRRDDDRRGYDDRDGDRGHGRDHDRGNDKHHGKGHNKDD